MNLLFLNIKVRRAQLLSDSLDEVRTHTRTRGIIIKMFTIFSDMDLTDTHMETKHVGEVSLGACLPETQRNVLNVVKGCIFNRLKTQKSLRPVLKENLRSHGSVVIKILFHTGLRK